MNQPIKTKTIEEYRGAIVLDQPYFYIVHKVCGKVVSYEVKRVEYSMEDLDNQIETMDVSIDAYNIIVKTIIRKCEDGEINLS